MFMEGFRGGSAKARILSGMRGVPKGALVVSMEADEFVVHTSSPCLDEELCRAHGVVTALPSDDETASFLTWQVLRNASHDLTHLAKMLYMKRVCAVQLLWKVLV